MSAYTTDVAAVAHQRIQDRIQAAEARRVVRSARASAVSAASMAAGPAQRRPYWHRVRFPRRAFV